MKLFFCSWLRTNLYLSSLKMLNLNISALKCFKKSCYQYSMEKQQICKPLINPVPMSMIKIGSNLITVGFIFCVCLATWILLSVDDISISKAKNRAVFYKKKQIWVYWSSLFCKPFIYYSTGLHRFSKYRQIRFYTFQFWCTLDY